MGIRGGWAVATGLTIAGVKLMAVDVALAQPVQVLEDQNRELVAKGFQAWADGTGSPYDLLSEDANWTISGNSLAAKSYSTKAAFISEVIQPFNARMQSRLIPSVPKLYAEGDTVIAHFDAQGIALDGRTYSNAYVWILELKDSKITRAVAFFDAIAFDDLWRRVRPRAN